MTPAEKSRPRGRPRTLSRPHAVQVLLEPHDLDVVDRWARSIGEPSRAAAIRAIIRQVAQDYEF